MAAPKTLEQMLEVSAFQEFRQAIAIQAKPVVAVVGSGLSAPAGLPTWPKLRERLVAELQGKASRLESSKEAQALAGQADSIARMENMWAAFGRLKDLLGETTYPAEIRAALNGAASADIPAAYEALWKTPVKGVLTVNLDSFTKRSFSSVHPGVELKWFNGREAGRLHHLLHGPHKFAFNLHGNVDDVASWVFTNDELSALYSYGGYKDLLRTVFTTYTVLFLGISADDLAIGGPLQRLAELRIQGPTHYWLTDRNDVSTDAWAEKAGIRLLPYAAPSGDHRLVLDVLKDLASAQAVEVEAPPVLLPSTGGAGPLPDPGALESLPTDRVRMLLNSRASEVLSGPGGELELDRILDKYEEAVHRAWFTSVQPDKNEIFGYRLQEMVARGAFGRVYRALDANDENVAVKVLLGEIRQDKPILHAFRRGVRAMRLLEENHVPGMVAYKSASEIPAFVAMEWIDGPNLTEAKDARLIEDWDSVLKVSRDLVRTIKSAHDLPDSVLHRDIRPANIMLRDAWHREMSEWELVVLDFDLSTFRGARQKSVLAQGSALGFLAPEQLEDRPKQSTRSGAVDSFGIGMTLLFLCSGVEPEAYSQRRADYQALVRAAVRVPSEARWKSLPARFGRMIESATRDVQSERVDVSQISRELERLQVVQSGASPADLGTDLLCEEIAARCPAIQDVYSWDVQTDRVHLRRPGGLDLSMSGAPESDRIELTVGWSSTGVEDRKNLSRYLPDRLSQAISALRGGRWDSVDGDTERQSLRLEAVVSRIEAGKHLDTIASALDRAVSALQFGDL